MKKTLICSLGLLLLVTAAWSQDGTEKAVAALEQQWLKSNQTNNPDLLAPPARRQIHKHVSRWESLQQGRDAGKWQENQMESAEYEDLKVTVFGDTAIATGAFKGKGTESGKPINPHERWTDTWVKMPNGQWQCVASQGAPIKK